MSVSVEACLLDGNRSLLDALRIIEHGGAGIALLIDSNRHFVGTLTDGDIRRALLAGAALDSPAVVFCKKDSTVVDVAYPRANVLDLMQSLLIHQIPILDKDRRVVGLHLLHEVTGLSLRPNWAVIMAGGRGTRLGDLTNALPKPMLRVAGRPILERLVLHLVGHGIRTIFLSVHYLANIIKSHFGDGKNFGCQIRYLEESEPLGTGGCLSLLPENPTHDVLVCNGDLVTQVNFDAMLRFHAGGGFAATVGASCYTHTIPFGVLKRNGDHLESIEEKPVLTREVNAGVYVLTPDAICEIPRKFFPITDAISSLLERNRPVGIYSIEDEWIDVGEREQLMKARGTRLF